MSGTTGTGWRAIAGRRVLASTAREGSASRRCVNAPRLWVGSCASNPPKWARSSTSTSPASAGSAGGAAEMAIRVMLVDDHPVVRDGLHGVFAADEDFEVVAEAADGQEA